MVRRLVVLAALLLGLVAAHARDGAPSRLFPYYEEDAGVLRLGQAVGVATGAEIRAAGTHYQLLLSTGIPDSRLGDGRLAIVRVYCCGGSIEEEQAIWVYVPPEVTVAAGDFIEIRMGRVPGQDDAGVVNTVVAVRQKADQSPSGPCFWQPDNPSLWMRVVYCDGIEKDGWVERKGVRKMWYRPATPASATATPAPPDTTAAAETLVPAPGDSTEGVPAAAPAATGRCFLVTVAAPQRAAVRTGAGMANPPLDVRFGEDAGADLCDRRVDLAFQGDVDRSSQVRNQGGAVATGLLGMLVGAITPWSCPTTYSVTASVGNQAGENLAAFRASKKVKRIGTMTMCPDAGEPGDDITIELLADVLSQVARGDAEAAAVAPPN